MTTTLKRRVPSIVTTSVTYDPWAGAWGASWAQFWIAATAVGTTVTKRVGNVTAPSVS